MHSRKKKLCYGRLRSRKDCYGSKSTRTGYGMRGKMYYGQKCGLFESKKKVYMRTKTDLQKWISLTLSRHFSLSFIASGRYSGLHPAFSRSCCMYVRVGRPAFARPYVGVHWSTLLMSSSLLLQLSPACLVRLTWIVFVMGGRWP